MGGWQKIKKRFGNQAEWGKSFSTLTTLQIGGPIKAFLEINSQQDLEDALEIANEFGLLYLVIGGGSNLLVSDQGFEGLVIKNNIVGISQQGNTLTVKSGTILQQLVDYTIKHGLSGMNKLTGIPGTLGGAIYGNAGAFGQTISNYITQVKALGNQYVVLDKNACQFSYRKSRFKKNKLVIVEVSFELPTENSKTLESQANEVLQKRKQKYKPGLLCPGSFFKNLLIDQVPSKVLETIPNVKDYYGKVPAWYFLEVVGAKGKKLGNIEIASHHANLFVNKGGGEAEDFYDLAKTYHQKVKDKFGINLESEVQLVNLPPIS